MYGKISTLAFVGIEARPVAVEVRITSGKPAFSIVGLPRATYTDEASVRTFADRALAAIRAVPGVESAGFTSQLPFSGDNNDSVILAEGYTMAPGESLICRHLPAMPVA